MKLIKPPQLKPGDTLGLVTCSNPMSSASPQIVDRLYERLTTRGFKVVEAPNCRKLVGHTAGTIKERVNALHDFFRDPKINGILNFWGGYQSHQLLEYLDFDLIKRNPKPFIGYSDTTALQVGMYTKAGLVTFSGPAGITYAKPELPEFSWSHFRDVVLEPRVPFKLEPSITYSDNLWFNEPDHKMVFQQNPGWKVYRKGQAQGPIVGGNVGTMLLLAGTPYWPKLRGALLFVEDDESESSRTMDRMFTQLRQMGVYDQIAGMVMGRFHRNVQFRDGDSLEMILDDALKGYRFPVITGVDFGHTDPLITFPLGIQCQMDTKSLDIRFLEPAVRPRTSRPSKKK